MTAPEAPSHRVAARRRRRFRRLLAIGVAGAVAILGVGAWVVYGLDERPGLAPRSPAAAPGEPGGGDMAGGEGPGGASMAGSPDAPRLPAVFGYYDGEGILFVHPETSDPAIAETLSAMMGSPVIVVPALADVPDTALAEVFVFADGVQPDGPRGPLGFQPDVFDSVPGDPGYRPLRRVRLVRWEASASPRVLASAAAVAQARTAGEISIEDPGVVVNMPVLRWPSGSR